MLLAVTGEAAMRGAVATPAGVVATRQKMSETASFVAVTRPFALADVAVTCVALSALTTGGRAPVTKVAAEDAALLPLESTANTL